MQTAQTIRRSGLTLLEVMVALVILGIVATGFLETFAGALRSTADARTMAQALVYANDGIEAVKIGGLTTDLGTEAVLGSGFRRMMKVQPWSRGVQRATVIVTWPNGGRLELDRLVSSP
jgi:prepilin-type N-terminal cleavage/methylation domain-containing protein